MRKVSQLKPDIVLRHVSKSFGNIEVLRDVSITMEGGHIYGFVGRNGSGKTVLMKCICGFIPVTSGEIEVNGNVIPKSARIPEGIGAIIETPGFLPQYSGYRNLKLLADIQGKTGKEGVRNALMKVGLDPLMRRHVSAYSLGMRQRLGIAQAIMEDPPILLLDEPMNSLDERAVGIVRRLLLEEKERGKLIVIATHVKEDVELLCDDVYQMRGGTAERMEI
ncbi:MAG: ABC transporter ATP-binding protein [Clostridia bacterium]|nr:ABC transporter ATP-binding protein [Clostridia bacterium]